MRERSDGSLRSAGQRRTVRRWSALIATALLLAAPPAGAQHGATPARLGAEVPGPDANLPALLAAARADADGAASFWSLRSAASRLPHLAAVDAAWRARLDALDFVALPRSEQVDWLLLDTHLKASAARRAREAARRAELAELLPFAEGLVALEEARWRTEPLDPAQAAQTLATLAAEVKSVRERVERGHAAARKASATPDSTPTDDATVEAKPPATSAGPEALPDPAPTAVLARRAAQTVAELSRALDDWAAHHDGFRPDFDWWCRKPREELSRQLADLRTLLHETVAGQKGEDDDPLVGDPIGRQALVEELAAELVAATPEELVALADAELAWCTEAMRAAAAELGHGEDWQAALSAVKGLHAPPGGQDALVRAQADEMQAFLDARALVTVPELCRQTWRLRMLDEERQKTLPYAAYGRQEMLVASPTRAMDHAAKLAAMRGNNEHFSRIVTPHELVPGHHLQSYMAQRAATHRRPWGTPFFTEGWALYWELRLWELGWHRGAEDRIGMLFWRMHRAARIRISLSFHLGELTPQEMIDFLVERVGHERQGATSEVRRYIGDSYGPLYQCAYLLGGLQLSALHDELVRSGGLSELAFHDAVLAQGPLPIALLRAALTEAPLSAAGATPEPVRRRP